MATDLHPALPAAPKPPARTRHDQLVARRIVRAQRRIRGLDVAAALLGFSILTLSFGLVVILCDKWLELSVVVRQVAFVIYLLAAAAYLFVAIVRPLTFRVNPYYAAHQLEQAVPDAKNSVINWLDLHQELLPSALRTAIGRKAAADLEQVHDEQAIGTRRVGYLGAILGGLLLVLLVFFVSGPRQFLSLVGRAFAPFVESSIATRTRLTLIKPESGDITVAIARAVAFSVEVAGRIPDPSKPDALRLLYRYSPSDPYEERLLQAEGSAYEWGTTVLASEVHNGFWYKIAGGDTE